MAPDRRADRARGRRRADPGGNVRIGHGASDRDLEQRLPHPHLEVGSDQDDAQGSLRAPLRRIENALRNGRGGGGVGDVAGARPAAGHVGKRRLFRAGIAEGKAG